ncbi:hypothetical protein F4775DRAFT_598645 [Biscogniauxia sp. FL1348]|nr:hypothetical protein F4775DRAFT_598645 [Biscogniauxia sp. FL1348]
MAPNILRETPTQEISRVNDITLGLSLACIFIFMFILMVIYFYRDVAAVCRSIGTYLLEQLARLGRICQPNTANHAQDNQNHSHHGHQSHIATGSNVEDLGPYIELQDMAPAHTVAQPLPSAVRSSTRRRDDSSQSSTQQPRTHQQIGIAVSDIDIDRRRPSTVQEEEPIGGGLTPPGRPRAAIWPLHSRGISQDFSHPSLVPAALEPKKQPSVRVPSSPVSSGVSAGIDDRQLRRTYSSPGSKRDARSSRAVSFPQYAGPSSADDGDNDNTEDYPPTIPARNPNRLSQSSSLSYRHSFASKPLPELPRRADTETVPSQSQSRSRSESRDHTRTSYAKPLFPPTSRDRESLASPMPASYASSQCLPNVGTAATMRSGTSGGRDVRPQRGHLPRTHAYGDLTALGERQQRLYANSSKRNGKVYDDDYDVAEESASALYESLSESDFGSTVVHASPTRK